ncbi:MAG: LegC family aminotransferase [Balneolaceae bacterium]|nr:LegC family aminotransferase [Balneolaceae bacterium]
MKEILDFIRSIYPNRETIPLHSPVFLGNEKKYLLDTIDSTFVSSVGAFVDQFEQMICEYTGSKHAVAVVNGTSALHIALMLSGVQRDDLVITQALSFVATANAIRYLGADPVFLDIDKDSFGLSPIALGNYLKNSTCRDNKTNQLLDKASKRPIKACVPMHTFGFPCRIDEITDLCNEYGITVVEDAAESLGSIYKGRHTGSFGQLGVYSFNGNKTVTAGGGGIIVTNNRELAERAKHVTTQSKKAHSWEYYHDQIGYNYRCPNLNAALACAQLEVIEIIINNKRETHRMYSDFFSDSDPRFLQEPGNCRSNCWLNSIIFSSKKERDKFLSFSNEQGVMTRPAWNLLNTLPMYGNCLHDGLENSKIVQDRLVNLPSSFRN